MKITLSYNLVTLENVLIADTFLARFKGYMFQKKPKYKAILIKPCNSIHTFFMKFDLDVLFLDENMKVVKKMEALKPNKMIMPIKEAKYVLEGKAKAFAKIDLGDVLYFNK